MKRIFPLFLGAVLLAPLPLMAATFDDACAPETEHTPGILAPNVGFMLDQSGSMGWPSSVYGVTRWDAAVSAINETVSAFTIPGNCTGPSDPNCDKVRFGIGFFSDDAFFPIGVDEDTQTTIAIALGGRSPEGATEMGKAAEALKQESSLNDATRTNHAVFITDGYPYSGCIYEQNQNALIDAVLALCGASQRSNPLVTNVIGFGGDTHAPTLHFLAAAGGTGSCCDPSDCSNKPIDVCSLERSDLNAFLEIVDFDGCGQYALPDPNKIACTGAIDVTSNTELKNAIADIVQEASCTFPLDIPADYPDLSASADTDFTRVEINHTVFGNVVLQNVGDCDMPSSPSYGYLPANEGWCFVNNRRGIRVTDQLCSEIGTHEIDKVITQVACRCRLTGRACSFTDVMCGGVQCSPDQLANMPCSAGEYICDAGIDVCAATGNGKLPEICNGVDDNCDGKVDNLGESEPDWDTLATPAQKNGTGLHCEFQDVCACQPGISAAVVTSGGVDALLASAIPECVCQANLEFDESPIAGGEEENNQQDKYAACSALSKGPSGLLYILLPIGLIGLIRRRRRS